MIRRLRHNLDTRFARIVDHGSYNFEPLYVLATYLDPRYNLILDGPLLEAAKRELKLLVSLFL